MSEEIVEFYRKAWEFFSGYMSRNDGYVLPLLHRFTTAQFPSLLSEKERQVLETLYNAGEDGIEIASFMREVSVIMFFKLHALGFIYVYTPDDENGVALAISSDFNTMIHDYINK